jgi:putative ABC transport system ATP-binding protein
MFEPVIDVRDLTKVYRMGSMSVHALCGVTLQIMPGEMTAIMGPSGSGKSTLMHLLGCLDQPTSGDYYLDGVLVTRLNDSGLTRIRRYKIGFVFQSYNLLARTSALANVQLPMLYSGVGGRERRRRATEALTLVGLGDRLHHQPSELSGGEQQRVAIARALVTAPAIILADEPTGNLDSKSGAEVMAIFQRLNFELGSTLVLVTHSDEIARHAQRIIHMRDGVVEYDEIVADRLFAAPPQLDGYDAVGLEAVAADSYAPEVVPEQSA